MFVGNLGAPVSKLAYYYTHSDISDLIEDNDIDILLMTETWLKEQGDEAYIAEMTPSDYVTKSFPRGQRGGGGIALIIRKSLDKHTVVERPFFTSFEAVVAIFSYVDISLPIICIYRPPTSQANKATTRTFLQEFPITARHCLFKES